MRVLVDGIVFPESPRWHQDRLWFVDMFANRVMSTDLEGHVEIIGEFDDLTSGLGFLEDGSPLVVVRRRRQILKFDGSHWNVYADLTDIPATWLNDMIVGPRNRAYVDSTIRPSSGDKGADCIVLVEPDGSHRVVSDEVVGPNGLAITPDGKHLICANTRQQTLLEFEILADGGLGRPTLFASTTPATPDGICLDEADAVWIGGVHSGRFDRIARGGAVVQSIATDNKWAVACVLGGSHRRTLFMATALTSAEMLFGSSQPVSKGFIEIVDVEVGGAGWP